jgi:hypothetical protein
VVAGKVAKEEKAVVCCPLICGFKVGSADFLPRKRWFVKWWWVFRRRWLVSSDFELTYLY